MKNSDIGTGRRFSTTNRRVTRREMVRRVLRGLGASFAFSVAAPAHAVVRHLENTCAMDHADAVAAAENWAPEFFEPHQNATFMALAEGIVPGSAKVYVNRVVDLLLSVDTKTIQQEFSASLAAIDGESLHRFGQRYSALRGVQREEVLALISTGKASDFGSESDGDPDVQEHHADVTLRDHFENLKGWIVGVYYSSEAGMRELGWTENVFFSNFPGCQHKEQH